MTEKPTDFEPNLELDSVPVVNVKSARNFRDLNLIRDSNNSHSSDTASQRLERFNKSNQMLSNFIKHEVNEKLPEPAKDIYLAALAEARKNINNEDVCVIAAWFSVLTHYHKNMDDEWVINEDPPFPFI